MAELLAAVQGHLETFLLVACRLGALTASAPLLGHRAVPPPHRVLLGLLLAALLAPVVGPPEPGVGASLASWLPALAGEVLVGLAIGAVAWLLLAAVQTAGELIGLQMGFQLAAAADPSLGGETGPTTRLLESLALLALLSVSGHHLLLRAAAASFDRVRLGALPGLAGSAAGLVTLAGRALEAGLFLAAPLAGLVAVLHVGLALLARVAPQAHVFAVGFPLTVAGGLVALGQVLPALLHGLNRWLAGLGEDLVLVLGSIHGLR